MRASCMTTPQWGQDGGFTSLGKGNLEGNDKKRGDQRTSNRALKGIFSQKPSRDISRLSQNLTVHRQFFAMVRECDMCSRKGGIVMRAGLSEILLFSCMGAFFVGLMVAAASLLG